MSPRSRGSLINRASLPPVRNDTLPDPKSKQPTRPTVTRLRDLFTAVDTSSDKVRSAKPLVYMFSAWMCVRVWGSASQLDMVFYGITEFGVRVVGVVALSGSIIILVDMLF